MTLSADAERWNRRYAEQTDDKLEPPPAEVLSENALLLPPRGRALDLACGLGGNAFFLLKRGLECAAWDVSEVAIERVRALAQKRGVTLAAIVRDVCREPPAASSFDVIAVSRFLDRALMPALIAALRPQGLLFYQTFCRSKVDPEVGPGKAEFLLADNELLSLCRGLTLRAYRENGLAGDRAQGLRNSAWLVGQKP